LRQGRVDSHVAVDEAGARGLYTVDLGEAWAPPVLRGGGGADGRPRRHAFEAEFVRLARFDLVDSEMHARARLDRYLELYGVPPTLGTLRERFRVLLAARCVDALDLEAILRFPGSGVREDDLRAREAEDLPALEPFVLGLFERSAAWGASTPDVTALRVLDRRRVRAWTRITDWTWGLDAIRARLACEGLLRGRVPIGAEYDQKTRNAVAELERRHRIYARGALSGPTLSALRTDPLELERRALVRVLTERVVVDRGIIEDGSAVDAEGRPATYLDESGARVAVPDLEAEVQRALIRALGLDDVERAVTFLEDLGELPADGHRVVAFEGPALPPYYGPDMELSVEIDRGDVWYDFPFDARGRRRAQPIQRRPVLTLYALHAGERVPLVRYGTTIGAWRLERVRNQVVWKYKESPVGPRVWRRIDGAPVWVPPPSTPDADLVTQYRRDEDGELVPEVKTNLIGPGYASAYGLVAAYHERPSGREPVDEGIRTHGSVDYTSIWRRPSHGCHRLHNHRAIRLFSFVLAHRPHRRLGHRPLAFRRTVRTAGFEGELRIAQSGYTFVLGRPIPVDVLPGRVRGTLQRASTATYPWEPGQVDP
jgi:hypothetical protein